MNYVGIRRQNKPGDIPGYTESDIETAKEVSAQIMNYKPDLFEFIQDATVEDLAKCQGKGPVSWVNINGLTDPRWVNGVRDVFKIHPLVLEDILSVDQRPKMEDYGDYIYITFKMLRFVNEEVIHEHVSLLLGDSWVISFQEMEGDVFDSVRDRIEHGKGRVRKQGADYLACVLLDVVVDHYFTILDELGTDIEEIEEEIFREPEEQQLEDIHWLKKELLSVRKAVMPLREAVAQVDRSASPLIADNTFKYFRDVYDHIIQVAEILESYRDISASLKDVYMSSVSFRMNKVVQVLTIISTIFIPLTFIAGIYGMNFDYIPELDYEYGYFITWAVMILITIGMVIYFRRKKWF